MTTIAGVALNKAIKSNGKHNLLTLNHAHLAILNLATYDRSLRILDLPYFVVPRLLNGKGEG